MNKNSSSTFFLILCVLGFVGSVGCETIPPPVVVYEDQRSSVRVEFDVRAKTGHDHPVDLTPGKMAKILQGLWVVDRNSVVGFDLLTDELGRQAFSKTEVTKLSSYLSQALKKASSRDMVTFHLIIRGERGPLITSGGLYVQSNRLYFILANWRESPSVTSSRGVTGMELNNRDYPLEPIGVYRIKLSFSPQEAQISTQDLGLFGRSQLYRDPAQMVIIDLGKLLKKPDPSSG